MAPPPPGPYGQPQQGVYAPPAQAPGYGAAPYAQPQAAPPPPSAPQPAPASPYGGTGPYGAPPQGAYGGSPPASAPQSAPAGGMRPCPSCQTPNPPQFKFCGACGTPLPAAAPQSAPQAAPMAAPPMAAPPMAAPPMAAPPLGAPMAPNPAAAPPPDGAAKTMFMDASQVPGMMGNAPAPTVAMIRMVLLREDGTEGGVLVIEGGPETIGRAHGAPFDSDAYLSPNHAELTATKEGLLIDDKGSLNGVFMKLDGKVDLQHGDLFRVGQELLHYEDLPEPTATDDGTERMGSPNPAYWGRVSVMVSPNRSIAAYPIKDEGVAIGRENGEITFPDDGYVSGSHCRIFGDDEGVFLEDLGSSNGTYMRVRRGQLIQPGTLILIGQQLFRIELG